uniref:Protein FAR1-RELATED SEQUENCE n=1 Tax=Arundo donax TaxID=35708 RepID=A0A0A9E1P1_ARUDO
MFQKFQDQLKQLMNVNCSEVSRNGSIVTYTVTVIGKERKFDYRVMYNSAEKEVWCICRSFQFKGILCSHALAVLKQELVMLIPPKYILDRWRKDYKCPEEPKETPISPKVVKATGKGSKPENVGEDKVDNLYKHGHQYFADIVEMGATDPDAMEYVLSVMKEAKEKVRKFEESRKDKRLGESPVSAGKKGGKSSKPSTEDVGNATSASTPVPAVVATVAVASSAQMTAAPTMMAMAPASAAVPPGMFLVPMHPHPMVFPPFAPAVPPAVAPTAPPAAPATNVGDVASKSLKKRKKRKGSN